MIFQFILFVPVIFICLFLLYIFSRQDFVLLRQNISLSEIFDLSIISLTIALISGRVFSIFNDFNFQLLNILAFFHFVNFPGFTYLGFFVGGALSIIFLFKKRKSLSRILDIFSIAFFPAFGFFITVDLIKLNPVLVSAVFIIWVIVFSLFVVFHKRFTVRDGGISALFLILLFLTSFSYGFFAPGKKELLFSLSFAQLVSIPLGVSGLIALFLTQKR